MVFAITDKTEQQYSETPENLHRITLAKNRATNGRAGDRALYELIEQQRPNIRSAIRKRCQHLSFLEPEELELSAIEGIINRLETYDPSLGAKFSSWAYFGILQGIDRVCRNAIRNYKATLEVQYQIPAFTEEEHPDAEFLEKIYAEISVFPEPVQEIIGLVLEGWRYTEIGKMLGKSADAIRMTYKRGIKRIQEILTPPEPQPQFKLTRRWLCNQLSKVVRKFSELRIPKRTLSPRETPFTMSTTTTRRPEHGKIPLSYYQVEGWQNRFQSVSHFNLTSRGRLFVIVLLGIGLGLILHQDPTQAQCAGWLCGGRDAILANDMWGANTPQADVIVNGVFLALQFIAALLIAVPLLIASALGIRREDYTPFFVGSAIIFMALIAINFMVGWLFGV